MPYVRTVPRLGPRSGVLDAESCPDKGGLAEGGQKVCTNLSRGALIWPPNAVAPAALRVDRLSMAEVTAWRDEARGGSQDADLLSTAGYDDVGKLQYLVLAVQTSRSPLPPSSGADIGHSDRKGRGPNHPTTARDRRRARNGVRTNLAQVGPRPDA